MAMRIHNAFLPKCDIENLKHVLYNYLKCCKENGATAIHNSDLIYTCRQIILMCRYFFVVKYLCSTFQFDSGKMHSVCMYFCAPILTLPD